MLKPVTVCSSPNTIVFLAARAAGVRGTAAHALANGAACRFEAFELEPAAVIAAAEPASPNTAAAIATRNQTRLCIWMYLPLVCIRELSASAADPLPTLDERLSRAKTPRPGRRQSRLAARDRYQSLGPMSSAHLARLTG